MIQISKSQTADTRTCDFANVSRETLLASSRQHISDVVQALAFFQTCLTRAAGEHDYDKLTTIDYFHADFVTGFKQTGWWDNHRHIHRHHLDKHDGVPAQVNLLDVLEHIADCVMAGMARSGSVYELKLSDELLQQAFKNTVELLKSQVIVMEDMVTKASTPPDNLHHFQSFLHDEHRQPRNSMITTPPTSPSDSRPRWPGCEHGLPRDQCDLCRPAPALSNAGDLCPHGFSLCLECKECERETSAPGASNQLRVEIRNLIRRYGRESDVTVYQAIGILEIVKLDLVDMLEKAREE